MAQELAGGYAWQSTSVNEERRDIELNSILMNIKFVVLGM